MPSLRQLPPSCSYVADEIGPSDNGTDTTGNVKSSLRWDKWNSFHIGEQHRIWVFRLAVEGCSFVSQIFVPLDGLGRYPKSKVAYDRGNEESLHESLE